MFDVTDETLRSVLSAALHSGLRRGELFALTWQDIDIKQRVIRVVQTQNGKPREIPMRDTFRRTVIHFPRHLTSDYVFPGKMG